MMGHDRRILAAASFAIAAACGGSSGPTYNLSGSSSITSGTIGGVTVAPADAVSNIVSQPGGSAAAILIVSQANECSRVNARQALKNGQALALEFGTQSGNNVSPPGPGTYNVFTQAGIVSQQGNVGLAQFTTTNAACAGAVTEASGGTITLTSVAATGYVGSFHLTFGADTIDGTFNTGTCSAFGSGQQSTCPP